MISGRELTEYIVFKFKRVGSKQLQKIAYLSELEYMKKYGERLSDLTFKKYYYGPYSGEIYEIKEESENIHIQTENANLYTYKPASIKDGAKIDIPSDISGFLDSIFVKFKDKTGADLEKIADNTEPYIDTETIGDNIDLDGYVEYYKDLLSDDFWKNAEEKDKQNEENHVYGKLIVKSKEDLDRIFG
jgi:uncharacterized phage-associated protein